MANLRSTPRAFERPPGIVAVAGPVFGAALAVLVLFTAVLTEEPPWVYGWGAACSALLIGSGVWAWRRPGQLSAAARLGLVGGTLGLAVGSPALSLWLWAALTERALAWPDFVVFAANTSILCACYLALLAADRVRGVRIARAERRTRLAAHAERRARLPAHVPMPLT